MLAVLLDIVNAFNTLLWDEVVRALAYHDRIPRHHCGGLLPTQDEYRVYLNIETKTIRRWKKSMSCDDQQRLVLDPLLWDIVYDKVLHLVRWGITPYAMMTPNHSRRKRLGDAVANAMASVIDTIREMVLEMMPEKTEAIFIFDKGEGATTSTSRKIETATMRGPTMKYLSLTLNEL